MKELMVVLPDSHAKEKYYFFFIESFIHPNGTRQSRIRKSNFLVGSIREILQWNAVLMLRDNNKIVPNKDRLL